MMSRNDGGSGEFCGGMRADCRRITMGSIGGTRPREKKNRDEIEEEKLNAYLIVTMMRG